MKKKFIIIDDDPASNLIGKILLKKAALSHCLGEDLALDISTFDNPLDGMGHILEHYGSNQNDQAILLLDVNMPYMTGWECLEKFNTYDGQIKERIQIYMLSSSIDPRDIDRAENHPHVVKFLSKPLTQETIFNIFANLSCN